MALAILFTMGKSTRCLRRSGWAKLLCLWGLLFVGGAVSLGRAQAESRGAPAASKPSVAAPTEPARRATDELTSRSELDTPRRCLERFLHAVYERDFYAAAGSLPQLSTDVEESRHLARKLAAVLERRLPIDAELLGKLSDAPEGDTKDGLPDQDELGVIRTPYSVESIRLERGNQDNQNGGPKWTFSVSTVERVHSLYEKLPDHFALEYFPEVLLAVGPLGLLYWQVLALPLLLLGCAAAALMLSRALLPLLLRRLNQRDQSLAVALTERLRGPLQLLLAALLGLPLMSLLLLTPRSGQAVAALLHIGIIIAVCWAGGRAVDVLATRARLSAWLQSRPGLLGAMPLLHRLSGSVLWSLALVLALQELGFSVASLLAGLGLSGLAVALAAKNTLEHLFGGLALSLDQPMRIGDSVKVDDVVGTVEQIGLRSTRIRTAERSLVTIPNGKLADMKIEALAARDRSRVVLSLGVVYALRVVGLRALHKALLSCVRAQPQLWTERVCVNFTNLGENTLTVEIQAWFQTTDSDQFLEARQELILSLVEVIESFGATTAFARLNAPSAAPAASSAPVTTVAAPPAASR